jgi:hypothetical protein
VEGIQLGVPLVKQFVGYGGEFKGTVKDVDTEVDAGGRVVQGLFFRVL